MAFNHPPPPLSKFIKKRVKNEEIDVSRKT